MTDNPKDSKAVAADGNQTDGSNEEIKQPDVRQDAFVVFTSEKDLRHHEAIRIKASLYTGIALRVKVIAPNAMENLLYAIDLDSGMIQSKTQDVAKSEGPASDDERSVDASQANPNQSKAGIVNLRFEECKLTRKAAAFLSEWLKNKALIETICFLRVSFEDFTDFKKVTEGVKCNGKLVKLSFQQMNFDEEIFGKSVGRILSDSRTIRELDVTHVLFDYRTFYDMCQAILNERCRLNVLKMRGLFVSEIEGKIIQFILMKNKQIHTLDLSECKTDDPANFDFFFEKLNQFCNVRYLTLEKMQPDLSSNIETIGEALAENSRLEVLILRENRVKWVPYQNFFAALLPNRSLLKINLQKTDLSDRVVEKLCKYLEQEDIALADLDISKNQVSDAGLKNLSMALHTNRSLMYLNVSSNKIKDEGLEAFVELLKVNGTLAEVALGSNIISNDGIAVLAQFLPHNATLRHLDLSRNSFNDTGFDVFADALSQNAGLVFLDIAKNKDVTDEGSLVTLCDALTENKKLQTLDLTGLQIRKPFLKQSFDKALKRNITLQEVIGKISHNIIQPELEQNIVIEREILPLYQPKYRAARGEFSLRLVEEDPESHSRLCLRDQPARLIKPAFKLIRYHDIRSVDFTNSGIQDDNLRLLALYLRQNPNLRSIVLDKNLFTDDGMGKIVAELGKNTKLAHLSIRGCSNVTNSGLQKLCDVISTTNTSLFQVDLDIEQFDEDLARTVITESALNRDIQEKLKPVKIVTRVGASGEVLTVEKGAPEVEHKVPIETTDSDEDPKATPALDITAPVSRNSAMSQDQTNATDASVSLAPASKLSTLAELKEAPPVVGPEDDPSQPRTIVEVKFNEGARVGACFESALKAWRISLPNIITVEDQDLTDEHIEKLCAFLGDREMISHLNLRRNMISNAGAKCLGRFISEFDSSLTHLDLTRNRIGQDGGKAILDALNATTRIVDCQIKYGNPISAKMGRTIEREIKANIQGQSYAEELQANGSAAKYELIDKGPDYMRCAVKMAELHRILFLSLPDNMLALEDARMIAQLVRLNTPLRKLNLRMNQLDADCAAVIANALIYNKNLQLLDVSKNMLGDLGVYLLLTPLIRKHLQEQGIVSKATPVLYEKELIQGKNVKASKRLFKNIPILTQLQYLSLEENMTTWEAYKQVWLVMLADADISVKIEDPATMKNRDNLSLFSPPPAPPEPKLDTSLNSSTQAPAPNAVAPAPEKKPGGEALDESKNALLDEKGKSEEAPAPDKGDAADESAEREASGLDTEKDLDELDDEQILELERKALEEERARLLAEKQARAHERKRRRVACCQAFCCFQDEAREFNLDDRMPSYTQICCWRFLSARRQSVKFYMSHETLDFFERSGCSVFTGLLISFNYLLLYAVVIVPFVLVLTSEEVESITVDGELVFCEDDRHACDEKEEENRVNFNNFVLLVNAAVLVYSMLCELVIICTSLSPSDTRCNSYLACQLLTGLTMRAVILVSAQLIAVLTRDVDIVNFALGVVLASTLVLSQIRAFQIWLASIKKDKNCLLPRVMQNFKICMSTNYLAAATLYKKVSVEASEAAIAQTRALEAQRAHLMSFSGFDDEADGKKSSRKAGVKAKLSKCKCCRWTSPKFYQMTMNDLPLLFCLPFAYLFGLLDNVNAAVGVLFTLLDLLFMIFYLCYDEELSIDAKRVYEISENRLYLRRTAHAKLLSDELSFGDLEDEDLVDQDLNADDQKQGFVSDPDQGSQGQEINEMIATDQNQNSAAPQPSQIDQAKEVGGGQILESIEGMQRVEQKDQLVVNDNNTRKDIGLLPNITPDTHVDRSNFSPRLM